jgi:hypothetical protein
MQSGPSVVVIVPAALLLVGGFIAVSSLFRRANRGDTSQGQASARPHNQMGPLGYVVVGFAVVGAMMFAANSSPTDQRQGDPATHQIAQADSSDVSLTETANNAGSEIDLPKWTRIKEVVIEPTRVPKVHFVVKSDQKATIKEARTNAIEKASQVLKDRWKDLYPEIVKRKDILDEEAFAKHSQQNQAVAKFIKEAGGNEYAMYEYYVQFEDSAFVREPIADSWRATLVDKRTSQSVVGAGAIALFLGTFSAFLRVFLAASGYRKKPIVAATTLGIATTAFMFLA